MVRNERLRSIALFTATLATVSALSAQVSVSRNGGGESVAWIAGDMSTNTAEAGLFADVENKTFGCSLLPPVMRYLQNLKEGDRLAGMVSERGAISSGREGGWPIKAIIKIDKDHFVVIMPGTLTMKVSVNAGEVLHTDDYDIKSTRAVKAGDSISVLYILPLWEANFKVFLSTGEDDTVPPNQRAAPWLSALHSGVDNRDGIVAAWRTVVRSR
ncbi:MAG: hypothetical protein ABR987_11585 [Terracidiphilus sp.]